MGGKERRRRNVLLVYEGEAIRTRHRRGKK